MNACLKLPPRGESLLLYLAFTFWGAAVISAVVDVSYASSIITQTSADWEVWLDRVWKVLLNPAGCLCV